MFPIASARAESVLEIKLTGTSYTLPGANTWDYDKVVIGAKTKEDLKDELVNDNYTEDDFEDDYGDYQAPTYGYVYINSDLTVAEGTQVECGGGFGLVFRSGAKLTAVGSPEHPILFKGSEWAGMSFSSVWRETKLQYCTIKGGKKNQGGGLYFSACSNIDIRNCTISENSANYGSGIYIYNSSDITLKYNTIQNNNESLAGGGIYIENSTLTLEDNTIKSNSDCLAGGGIYIKNATPGTLLNNWICSNGAQNGGGIFLNDSDVVFQNCIVNNNTGTNQGGALYCLDSNPQFTYALFCNNSTVKQGGAIFCSNSSPNIKNSVIHGNILAEVDDEGEILDEGDPDQIYLDGASSKPTISYCLVEGGQSALAGSGGGSAFGGTYTHNIDGDPEFTAPTATAGNKTDATAVDWTLKAISPCINAGRKVSPYTDLIGNERPFNGVAVDLGVFEFQNNPPFIGDDEESFTTTWSPTTEDISVIITPSSGYDVDDDDLGYRIDTRPTNGGKLYHYDAEKPNFQGNEVAYDGEELTDAKGRVVFVPGNRRSDYSDSFIIRVKDIHADDDTLDMDSPNAETLSILVSADNDAPSFASAPEPTATVPFEYIGTVGVEDPDMEDVGAELTVSAVSKPAWVDFTDNKDGTATLSGTPTDDDVGKYTLTLRVEDPAGDYAEQEFELTVNPRRELEVSAGDDISVEPGTEVALKATGADGDTTTVHWIIMDENGTVLLESDEKNITYTFDSEGLYSAEVSAEDTIGSIPASDSIAIAVGVGFETVNDEDRVEPDVEQAAAIDELAELDPSSEDYDTDASIDQITAAAAMNLDESQRDSVLAGIETIVANDSLSADQAKKLLGALDNLVLEDGDADQALTSDQFDKALSILEQLQNSETLDNLLAAKGVEVLNELIGQQDLENLSVDQVQAVESLVDGLLTKAMDLGTELNADNGDAVKINMAKISLSPLPTEDVVLGGDTADDVSVVLSPEMLAEILSQTGATEILVGAATNTVTAPGHGPVVSIVIYDENGQPIHVTDLKNPVQITLPVTDDTMKTPMCRTSEAEVWSGKGIFDTEETSTGGIFFKVSHLTDFALFTNENVPPVMGDDWSDIQTQGGATDEYSDITITLTGGTDAEGDPLSIRIVSLPEMGGTLYQYEDGTRGAEIAENGDVTDDQGRVIYAPANRAEDYEDTFVCKLNDGTDDSVNQETISISVTATDDAPRFTSTPVETGQAMELYSYEIETEDDLDQESGTVLKITADILPTWLTLTDRGDGTALLQGTPGIEDTGDFTVSLTVSDDGGNTGVQTFEITVAEADIVQLAVDAGTDITGEPGVAVSMNANNESDSALSYAWTITDEDGATVAAYATAAISFTPTSQGIYTAAITVSDNKGNLPGTDEVILAITDGYTNLTDDARLTPDDDQAAFIESLADDDTDETIESLLEVSTLVLDQDQLALVLAAVEDDLITESLSNDQVYQLLGALDNLIIEEDAADSEILTTAQVTNLIDTLETFLSLQDMNRLQIPKVIEILNETAAQQTEDGFDFDQGSRLRLLVEEIATQAAGLGATVKAASRAYVQLCVYWLEFSEDTPEDDITVGDPRTDKVNVVLTPDLFTELGDTIADTRSALSFIGNRINGVMDGLLLTLRMVNEADETQSIGTVETAFEITIPVIDTSRLSPMYHDRDTGQWLDDGISSVRVSDDQGSVVFYVNHLTDFALFPETQDPDTGIVDEVLDEASDAGGGCFIFTLLPW